MDPKVHLEALIRGEPAGFAVCSYRAKYVLTDVLSEVTCKRCKQTREYKS